MTKIILASSSAYRKIALENLKIPFDTYSTDVNEDELPNETAKQLVTRLSKAKALAAQKIYPDAICIGGDSVANFNNTIYGKPLNEEAAFNQLSNFSGNTINFYTGLCIVCESKSYIFEKTHQVDVLFKNISEKTIRNYIAKDQPLYSCGSIKAEGLGLALLKSINSDDPTALIGLPVIDVCDALQELGVEVV
jgi:septum formation protein